MNVWGKASSLLLPVPNAGAGDNVDQFWILSFPQGLRNPLPKCEDDKALPLVTANMCS